jgi:hypothetical protein
LTKYPDFRDVILRYVEQVGYATKQQLIQAMAQHYKTSTEGTEFERMRNNLGVQLSALVEEGLLLRPDFGEYQWPRENKAK